MSIFAPAVSSLWRQIEDYGIEPGPLFKQYGIDPGLKFDTHARVSQSKIDQVTTVAAQLTGDPFFGLKEADYFLPTHLGPLGFAWLASTTLRSALHRLQRYSRVINDKIQIDLQANSREMVVTITTDAPSEDAYHREIGGLAILARMCRFVYGDDWNPLAVNITHPKPSDTSYFYSFFRCPVEFNAGANSIHIDAQQADERLSGSNQQLAQLNDHIVVKYLAGIDRNDIVNRVRSAILENLGEGGITETVAAKSLHMSTRNLNRKLAVEGTSFKNLLLEIRTELANQYINDTTLTFTEISYMLGFSEVSSFSRAYRRWTGHSPSAARQVQHT